VRLMPTDRTVWSEHQDSHSDRCPYQKLDCGRKTIRHRSVYLPAASHDILNIVLKEVGSGIDPWFCYSTPTSNGTGRRLKIVSWGNDTSSCSPFITVMESSNFGDLYHSTEFRPLDSPRFRRILCQRQTRSRV
jgi:hypothetical protein